MRNKTLALVLVIGAFLLSGATSAYAAEDLSVDEVWLTGDMLHIAVKDADSGESQALTLNLSDYAQTSDEYVTIQATDEAGRTSNAIQFKNPYYIESAAEEAAEVTEDAAPNSKNAFTPDGTGTVIDNVTDDAGKEFFTVETPDGNVFYLIVDRERTTDNVYLLDAVTEDDLASLAQSGDGSISAVPTPETTATPAPTPEPTVSPVEEAESGSGIGTYIFIGVAVLAIGGAGYYLKIVRPKKQSATGYDGEEYDEDAEPDMEEEE